MRSTQMVANKEKKAWGKKTKEELEFIVMKAELEQAKKSLNQRPRRTNDNPRTGPKNDGAWAWKSVARKEGEEHSKKFRGKDYIYCPHHGDTKWVLKVNNGGTDHATGCRIAAAANQQQVALTSSQDTKVDKRPPTKNEVLAKALANVMEEQMEDDEDIAAPPTP